MWLTCFIFASFALPGWLPRGHCAHPKPERLTQPCAWWQALLSSSSSPPGQPQPAAVPGGVRSVQQPQIAVLEELLPLTSSKRLCLVLAGGQGITLCSVWKHAESPAGTAAGLKANQMLARAAGSSMQGCRITSQGASKLQSTRFAAVPSVYNVFLQGIRHRWHSLISTWEMKASSPTVLIAQGALRGAGGSTSQPQQQPR